MISALIFIPIVLSFAALAAHFLRDGNVVAVVIVLMLAGLLVVRRPWVARMAQAALVLGAVEWLRTIDHLIGIRQASGQEFTRMVVILGIVAAFTIASALLFQLPNLKRLYGLVDRR